MAARPPYGPPVSSSSGSPAALLSLRILVGALLASPVVITVAMVFVLGSADDPFALSPLLLAPLVLGVVAFIVCELVGYRLRAIPPGTSQSDAEALSRVAFQERTMVRFVPGELVLFLSLAFGIVVSSGGFAFYLVGAVVSLALLAWHCWPSERIFARCQASLERDGGVSYLREAYGLPPARGGGVIQPL